MSETLDRRVIEAMRPFWQRRFGNPASDHAAGEAAAKAVDAARDAIAHLLGARSARGVVFVSGEAEATRLVAQFTLAGAEDPRACVRVVESSPTSERRPHGPSRSEEPLPPLDAHVALLSVPWVAPTGELRPLRDLCEVAHESGVPVHVALGSAAGCAPFSVQRVPVDALSLDGPALGAPAGVGVLWLRRGGLVRSRRGGSQEIDLRPGTLNVPAIAGLGAAARMASPGPSLVNLAGLLRAGLRVVAPHLEVDAPAGWAPGVLRLRGVRPESLDGIDTHGAGMLVVQRLPSEARIRLLPLVREADVRDLCSKLARDQA